MMPSSALASPDWFDPRPRAGSDGLRACKPPNVLELRSTPPRGERPGRSHAVAPRWSFRSTPPHGERPRDAQASQRTVEFRSTPPHGERRSGSRVHPLARCFDPRPRTGSDPPRPPLLQRPSSFDPRPRTGSDRPRRGDGARSRRFDPRPRTGSDVDWRLSREKPAVSIHAPARGATRRTWCRRRSRGCFDQRPRAGSDAPSRSDPDASMSFDPRPRAGSDDTLGRAITVGKLFRSTPPRGERRLGRIRHDRGLPVSIHAPARGATWTALGFLLVAGPFRSTPPHGERRAPPRTAKLPWLFRSTPPHGERRRGALVERRAGLFRSTPPHGERPAEGLDVAAVRRVSIHAPARGATAPCSRRGCSGTSFDPRPRTGERQCG